MMDIYDGKVLDLELGLKLIMPALHIYNWIIYLVSIYLNLLQRK